MNTDICKIYREECTPDEWHEFIEKMQSGEVFEVDEEMFYYWLEVLPPVYMGKTVEIEGVPIRCSFGFAEGTEQITDFWCKDGRFFGKRSNRINQ